VSDFVLEFPDPSAPEKVESAPLLPRSRPRKEEYDPSDPEHQRQRAEVGSAWDESWRPTIYEDIQPDGKTYLRRNAPEIEAKPLTDVERVFGWVQEKLNSDEEKRTGKPVNPDGAVPLSRAMAATCLIYFGWHYPTEADLETDFNQVLLSKIYEDPTANTNAKSSLDQKRRALHVTLVMLEGQSFGMTYQSQLGAYERTASGQFQTDLAKDRRDWLDGLECPKMHAAWPAFASVRAMFQAVMK
jgi:hypothetical protein